MVPPRDRSMTRFFFPQPVSWLVEVWKESEASGAYGFKEEQEITARPFGDLLNVYGLDGRIDGHYIITSRERRGEGSRREVDAAPQFVLALRVLQLREVF